MKTETHDININKFLKWELASRDTIDFKKVYVDVTGDLIAGLLLSQIVYWNLPNKKNESKLRVYKDSRAWLAKGRQDWWEEIRITPKQFDRAAKILVDKGIIETRLFKFNGYPTIHIYLFINELMNKIDNLNDVSFFPKGKNGFSPKGKMDFDQRVKSLTEITTKITNKDDDANNHQPVPNESDDRIIYDCQYFTITESKYRKYCKTFPTVKILPEFSKMELYLDDNVEKYQGPETINNFISSWLNRATEDVAMGKKKGIHKSDIPVVKSPIGWKDDTIPYGKPADYIE